MHSEQFRPLALNLPNAITVDTPKMSVRK